MDCIPSSLTQDSNCFTCLNSKQQLAIQAYVLAVLAGGSTDPASIFQSAIGLYSLTKKQLMAISAYLLCQLNGGAAACVTPQIPTLLDWSNGQLMSVDLSWVEAQDPKLDFLVSWGRVSGVYTNTQSFPASTRAGTLIVDTSLGEFVVIQARDSATCLSGFSTEINIPSPDF